MNASHMHPLVMDHVTNVAIHLSRLVSCALANWLSPLCQQSADSTSHELTCVYRPTAKEAAIECAPKEVTCSTHLGWWEHPKFGVHPLPYLVTFVLRHVLQLHSTAYSLQLSRH